MFRSLLALLIPTAPAPAPIRTTHIPAPERIQGPPAPVELDDSVEVGIRLHPPTAGRSWRREPVTAAGVARARVQHIPVCAHWGEVDFDDGNVLAFGAVVLA